MFFAWHVFWPRGWAAEKLAGGADVASVLIALAAMIALFRFKAGVIPVILACAGAGLAVSLAS